MIRKILGNTLTKKLAVFAVSFLVIGGMTAVTALSPQREAGAVLHVPPVDLTQTTSEPIRQRLADNCLRAATAAVHTSVEIALEQAALPAYAPVPVSQPLGPYVDTLGFFYLDQIPLGHELQEYTYNRCQSLGLEYEMVLAIMWRESMFKVEAVGVNRNGTRDNGLMQINDVNRGWLQEKHGIDDLLDPYQNIDAGTAILAEYFSKYGENQALMAYQYGEGGMLKKLQEGMATNDLTEKVKAKRDEYKLMRTNVYGNL